MDMENVQMTPQDQSGDFLEGWCEEQPKTTDASCDTDAETDAQNRDDPSETVWKLKHMGEERTMRSGEVTAELLQKGLDYDRVREKYDVAKPLIETLTHLAEQEDTTPTEYLRRLRREDKKNGGMTESEAERVLSLEDREAAFAAKESSAQELEQFRKERQGKIRDDLAQFARAFPDVYAAMVQNPDTIPKSVWQAVERENLSLCAAYARFAVGRRHETDNAARSVGSMHSAGNDTTAKDAFAAALERG